MSELVPGGELLARNGQSPLDLLGCVRPAPHEARPVAFATGTSWGTYAIMVPIALPLALEFDGGVGTLTLASFAAVVGGGVFGDHCSPLSDTTVLSSLGGACDHMDHTRTQIPYALVVAGVVSVFYLSIGFAATR